MAKPLIFISYSRKDREFVRRLAADLERAGYDPWWDVEDLRGGQAWAAEIEKHIRACNAFLVVLSPDSKLSEWVDNETHLALELRKLLIPLMWRGNERPITLQRYEYVNFRGNYADGLHPLLRALPASGLATPGTLDVRRNAKAPGPQERKQQGAQAGTETLTRYAAFVAACAAHGVQAKYRESTDGRLPAFSLLLFQRGSEMLYPHKLLAVVDGDNQTVEQIKSIAGQWKQTLLDLYKPSPWNGVSLEACLVVAVDANPYQLSPAILPWERSARAGGYYGVMADLQSYRVQHHDIALKDRGVRMWMLEPIVIPSLSELQRWGQR